MVDISERINIGRARFVIVVMILALIFLGARMGHRAWWLRKIVRDAEQEIVDVGFQLEKLESPIGPQLEAPVSIDTLAQFIEEAESVGAETIYFLPGNYLSEGSSFYLGRKGMYHYSYELDIVPLTWTFFPKYVAMSEKQAIEIGRDFLDGVGRKTGKVLFIKHEEKEPNFYWDIALNSDVEWDRLDIWDRMLKWDRPEIREIRPCWVIRFEQAKRPGHFYEVWLDAFEYVEVGGSSCK
jgi:hypothetical protein